MMATASDELRRLLDERGVEWSSIGGDTSWEDSRGWTATAEADSVDGSMVYVTALMTPEQAIAATLGNDGVERSKNGVAERDQLKDENDKLRELVRDMLINMGGCALRGNPLRIQEFGIRAAELGVVE